MKHHFRRALREHADRRETAAIAGYAVLMTSVCLLACVVPARRALRVEPASALRVKR